MSNPVASDILTFGQRDLTDFVTLVDSHEYPLFSMLPKGSTPTAITCEWPVDKHKAPSASVIAGAVDGADFTEFTSYQDDYNILSNKVQWFRSGVAIGEMAADTQNQAGVPSQTAYAFLKEMEFMKRNLEVRIGGDFEMQAPTGTTASQFRGMGNWILATAQTVSPVPAAHLTPSASIYTDTIANLTENSLDAVLTSQYQVTGKMKTRTLVCGTTFKAAFKGFIKSQFGSANVASSVRVFNQDGTSKKIVNTVDVYVGDYGTYELIPSLYLNYNTTTALGDIRRAYALDMDRWELAFVHPLKKKPLPDNGGGERWMLHTKLTLKCLNPRDQAAFKSTS
jgi:hypothetical protein